MQEFSSVSRKKKKTDRTAVARGNVQNVSLDSIKVQSFLEWEQSTFMIGMKRSGNIIT